MTALADVLCELDCSLGRMNSGLHPSMEFESSSATVADIGALLRASRLRLGEDLRQVAGQLRIRYVYLEAIEDGRFDELPGTTYAIGFIRTYSEYLGLDGEEIIRRFKAVETASAGKTDLVFPTIIPNHGIPGGAIVMVGLLVAVVGYGSWLFLSSHDVFVSDSVPPVTAQLAEQTKVETVEAKPDRQMSIVESSSAVAAPVALTPRQHVAAMAPEATSQLADQTEVPAATQGATQETMTGPATDATPETVTAAVFPETTSEPAPDQVSDAPSTPAAETPAPTTSTEEASVAATTHVPQGETAPASTEAESSGDTVLSTDTPNPAGTETSMASMMEPLSRSEPAGASAEASETLAPASDAAEPATTEVAALLQPPGAGGTSRITLTAKEASWIQVRDLDTNELILSKVLLKGHSYEVPNRSGLSLMTGNAGALHVTVNGELVPTLGNLGQVRQKVILDADRLKDGTAVEQ